MPRFTTLLYSTLLYSSPTEERMDLLLTPQMGSPRYDARCSLMRFMV
jgi:hypothetical protein